MVALSKTAKHDSSSTDVIGSRNGTGIQGEWKMVGTYQTIERAHEVAAQLMAEGVETQISMIGGLSLIAKK